MEQRGVGFGGADRFRREMKFKQVAECESSQIGIAVTQRAQSILLAELAQQRRDAVEQRHFVAGGEKNPKCALGEFGRARFGVTGLEHCAMQNLSAQARQLMG